MEQMNSDFIHINLDRSYKQTIPDNIKSEIALQIGNVDPDRAKIAFCGFLFKGSEAYVFMPRGSNIKDGALTNLDQARLLFQCLTKYCRTNESFLQKEGKSTLVGNPQILPLIAEILNDYKANGIYTSENSFTRRGFQGKTDWKKTIGGVSPHIEDEEVIYPHFINSFTNSFFSNEVTKIHYSILQAIKVRFGWLLPDLDSFTFGQNTRVSNRSADIGIIKSELMGVYNDSKIHTLKMLLRFMENDFHSGKAESVSYGFSDFQYVWEHMLRSVLSPTHAFSDMPMPAYREKSGRETPKPQKGQRVDIFLYEQSAKEVCVIDAKYYDGSSVDHAPGWPDLVKQFFYAKSLTAGNLKHEVTTVRNYFIFPGIARDASPDIVSVIDTSGHLDSDFPPIKCLHLPPEQIISSYISNKPLVELRRQLFN
jgi:hypothetical protein